MSFLELLKIEFIKIKRGKMIPLIFIAPLLVTASGVTNLQSYFSERISLCVLSAPAEHDCCVCNDSGPRNRK